MDEGEEDYMNMVEQIKKKKNKTVFWWSLTSFLLEAGYHPRTVGGDGHKGTDFSHPNFSCIQNNYKCESVFNAISQYKETP